MRSLLLAQLVAACYVNVDTVTNACNGEPSAYQCGDTYFSQQPPSSVQCCCLDNALTCTGFWYNAQTDIVIGTTPIHWHGTLDMACATTQINLTLQSTETPLQVWGAFCPCNQVLSVALTNSDLSTGAELLLLIVQENGNEFQGNLTLDANQMIDQANKDCGFWCPDQDCTVALSDDKSSVVLNLVYESKRSIDGDKLCIQPWVWGVGVMAFIVPAFIAVLLTLLRKRKKKITEEENRVDELDEMANAAAMYKEQQT